MSQKPLDIDENALVTQKAKEWFLQVSEEFARAQDFYNLEREFSKTRQRRSFLVLAAVILSVLVVGGVSFFLVAGYESRNNRVEVSTTEFEWVDLREILDRYRNLTADLLNQENALAGLASGEAEALAAIKSRLTESLALVNTANLTQAETERRIAALEARGREEEFRVRKDWGERKAAVQEKIAQAREAVDSLDQEVLERALSLEVVLNNERKLFDQEVARTRSEYDGRIRELEDQRAAERLERQRFAVNLERQALAVLRAERERLIRLYNPTFETPEARGLLDQEAQPPDNYRLKALAAAKEAGLLSDGDFEDTNRRLGAIDELYTLARSIPFINDSSLILAQFYLRTLDVLRSSQEPWGSVVSTVNAQKAEIARLDAVIASLEAKIAQRDARIAELEASLKLTQGELEAARDLALATENRWKKHGQRLAEQAQQGAGGYILAISPTGELFAYLPADPPHAPGARFYVTRKDTVPLGEYELAEQDGFFTILKPLALSKELQAQLGRLDQKLRAIVVGDWIIAVDKYKPPVKR